MVTHTVPEVSAYLTPGPQRVGELHLGVAELQLATAIEQTLNVLATVAEPGARVQ